MPSGLILKVAAEELGRYFRGFNRRVLLFILIAAVAGAVLFPAILDRGVVPDQGLYRAEVTPGSPLEPALHADPRFEVFEGHGGLFLDGHVDMHVQDTRVFYSDTERGRAAVQDFAQFAQRYFDDQLVTEPNQTAAFPVRVNIVYEVRAIPGAVGAVQPTQGQPAPTPGDFTRPNRSAILNRTGTQSLDLIPGQVEPPFPMRSLLLTFLYLVPFNFIGQYFAGSLLAERTRSRGLLLLSAPLTGPEILLGKTLPYLGLGLVLTIITTIWVQAGILGFVAILPVFAFFLAATAFAALVARSYRELTFFITTMSVALSTFLFLPAIFTQVHPIAFISPISVVAAEIRGEDVALESVLYSITPLGLAAVVLAILATILYREELLFAPRGILAKILAAVHLAARRPIGYFASGILVLPFVFALELFVLAFAVTLPLGAAIGLFLVAVAVVEEAAKALPSAAHYRYANARRSPWLVGGLVGTGFFVGEKLALLFSLVGLGLVPLGNTLLTTYGIATSVLVVVAPLGLHLVTSFLTAHGARYGRRILLIAFPLAVLLHVVYNAGVIRLAT